MNTTEFLGLSTIICPNREAIIYEGQRWAYSELAQRVNQLGDALSKLGVQKGDRVAILQVNCNEYVEAYFATAKLGAIYVPLNFRAKQDELTHMLHIAEAKILLAGKRYVDMVKSIRSNLSSVESYIVIDDGKAEGMLAYEELLTSGSAEEKEFTPINDDDPTVLMYTAGTTGLPKGVAHNHNSYSVYVMQNVNPPDPDIAETNLISMPLYHVAGMQAMMAAVYGGRTMALQSQFEVNEWFEIAQREKVTRVMLVPTMLKRIVEHPDFDKYDLSSLRVITYGAAACPYEVLDKAVKRFPGRVLINAFGGTETSSTIAMLRSDDYVITGKETEEEKGEKLKRLSSSIGIPLDDVEVQIRDEEGQPLPTGEVGELVVRGPRIMKGYWRDEEKTKGAFTSDGWYRTGDLGYMDEEKYIYLAGRADDLIVRGGENISPEEVENILYTHPAIEEAAVIGVPDLEWGQEPRAVVVLKKGQTATEDEIIEFCRAKLAGFKRPRSVVFVNELPKTSVGKVVRKDLRKQYGSP
jgi:acyl-CoA synthetase (AMP-forming)/AMP-acid ligase II